MEQIPLFAPPAPPAPRRYAYAVQACRNECGRTTGIADGVCYACRQENRG